MAHFAQLDENNKVINVIVIHNNELIAPNGEESELIGIQFCKDHYGENTKWIQTSYNGNFRKNYAGIGYAYDPNRDAFIPSKQFNSWILNENTCQWEPPVLYPNDGKDYIWDENDVSWKEFTPPT